VTREIIVTDLAPTSAAYSQAVRAGGLIFVSGQGPYDPSSGEIVGDTIQEQTRQCLTNVKSILEAGGSSMAAIASATFILDDPGDFGGMNEEWGRWFTSDKPARQGAKLPVSVPRMKVSIAVIAVG